MGKADFLKQQSEQDAQAVISELATEIGRLNIQIAALKSQVRKLSGIESAKPKDNSQE